MGYGPFNTGGGRSLNINVPGGVAGVGENGKIPENIIPDTVGGFVEMASSIPASERKPNKLYGLIEDDFTAAHTALGGVRNGSTET